MDELLGPRGAGSERFVTFAFGTFHTVIFIVSAVLVLHLSGALAGLLTGLNTLTGLALFAALWATTTWSTGRAIRGGRGTGPCDAHTDRVGCHARGTIWRA